MIKKQHLGWGHLAWETAGNSGLSQLVVETQLCTGGGSRVAGTGWREVPAPPDSGRVRRGAGFTEAE